jgi:hypothetical protein
MHGWKSSPTHKWSRQIEFFCLSIQYRLNSSKYSAKTTQDNDSPLITIRLVGGFSGLKNRDTFVRQQRGKQQGTPNFAVPYFL